MKHLGVGVQVKVVGLKVKTQRNGWMCKLVQWYEAKGAWVVEFLEDGVQMLVCEANLEGSEEHRATLQGRSTRAYSEFAPFGESAGETST